MRYVKFGYHQSNSVGGIVKDELKIFSCRASKQLATEISHYIGIPLGASYIDEFDNDNTWVKIEENVREVDVFIIQTSCRPVNHGLMEALIMADALRRASAKRITMVMPYFAYARSEKKDQPRVPITAALVGKMMKAAGVDRILTMDLHAEAIMGFFDGPVDQLLAEGLISDYLMKKQIPDLVAVSPDAGAVRRTRRYADRLGCPLAILDKQRDEKTVRFFNVIGDVKGRNAVIFDDEIASGGTMKDASLALRDFGAEKIYAACTHPVFGKHIRENLAESAFEQVVVTNSVPITLDPPPEKIWIISVAPLFGEAIKNIHTGESVSSLLPERIKNHE